MRLMFIRHADPDYEHDTLTEKGWREAELLADRLEKESIDAFYVSPMGRAKDTASVTLNRMHREAEELDWLHEFDMRIQEDGYEDTHIIWDRMPSYWTQEPTYYDKDRWFHKTPLLDNGVGVAAGRVLDAFDALIASYGYTRDNNLYKVTSPHAQTLVFFCHFGVSCLLLGHMLGISPMVLWHNCIAVPTAVTTLITEEREEGTAIFRLMTFGDTSHLTQAGEEPSFAGRFCEMYKNTDQRH